MEVAERNVRLLADGRHSSGYNVKHVLKQAHSDLKRADSRGTSRSLGNPYMQKQKKTHKLNVASTP